MEVKPVIEKVIEIPYIPYMKEQLDGLWFMFFINTVLIIFFEMKFYLYSIPLVIIVWGIFNTFKFFAFPQLRLRKVYEI